MWLARHIKSNKLFALKSIESVSAPLRQSIINDTSLIKFLNVDELMKCVDLYEYERTIWVFLEHLEYGSLAQIVHAYYTKYSEDCCKYILFKVCTALDAMHQQNVLHRDIKIDHVFCGQFGDVKLADLGLQLFFN